MNLGTGRHIGHVSAGVALAVLATLVGCGSVTERPTTATGPESASGAGAARGLTWEEIKMLSSSATPAMGTASGAAWKLHTNKLFMYEREDLAAWPANSAKIGPRCSELAVAAGTAPAEGHGYHEAQWKTADRQGEAFTIVVEGTDRESVRRFWSECSDYAALAAASVWVEGVPVAGVPVDVASGRVRGFDVSMAIVRLGGHVLIAAVSGQQSQGLATVIAERYITGAQALGVDLR